MGYGSPLLKEIEGLLASRADSGRPSMLELGAQEFNLDVPPSSILRLVYRLNPNFNKPEDLIRLMPGCFAAPAFRAANVRYSCIDLFEAEGVVQVDLNLSPLPAEHRSRHDLVTNVGTTEHIFNQARAFEAIHDATKVGGIMFHAVPGNGMFNHGLIKYEPKFFLYLAHVNKYEIVDWNVVEGTKPDYMPLNEEIPGCKSWIGRDLCQSLLRFVLRKRVDAPFVQPSDVDLRYVPLAYPTSIRNAAAPSTSSMPTPISAERGPNGRAERAGPDVIDCQLPELVRVLRLIEARCERMGLGAEPYALAASMLTGDFGPCIAALESNSPTVARNALDDVVGKALTGSVAPLDGCSIDLGLAFLGTGWGVAGGDVHGGQARHFRAVGPDGQSRLFVRLAPGRDYRVNTLLYNAVPGEAAHRLRVDPATDGRIEVLGEEYWHRSRLPKERIAGQSGLVELTVQAGQSDQMTLQKIVFEPE